MKQHPNANMIPEKAIVKRYYKNGEVGNYGGESRKEIIMYGIWKNEFVDNDGCNWYDTHDEAFDALHEAAKETENGESVYMAKFDEDGDIVEGSTRELRNEEGDVCEYDDRGSRLWA